MSVVSKLKFTVLLACICFACSKGTSTIAPIVVIPPVIVTPTPATPISQIEYWLTTGNKSSLLQKQNISLNFGAIANANPEIFIDSLQKFQEMDGFGYTLTGGSVLLINQLNSITKSELLQELFGQNENSIGINYLRLSIGASDLNESVFSYDDIPLGQTDIGLKNFSLSQDETTLVPLLKEIVKINPKIKLMATPWSPPVWMKNNGNSKGGSLLPEYYEVYANYLVKYIKTMKLYGIEIDAITIQNEPLNPNNNPSMLMTAIQQNTFIKFFLGPIFKANQINTKIILFDHNCDTPDYPISILNDPITKSYVDGSAFHLYAGNIAAMSTVKSAHQDKNIYFTEQWTSSTGEFSGDFNWHLKNVIIGGTRNWAKSILEWNLANDPTFGPRTPGGCTECKGALTIKSIAERNVSYYIIGQVSKFIPSGSTRIASNLLNRLPNVAFLTPKGEKVLLVLNENTSTTNFNIKFKDKWVAVTLPPQSAGTFIWK